MGPKHNPLKNKSTNQNSKSNTLEPTELNQMPINTNFPSKLETSLDKRSSTWWVLQFPYSSAPQLATQTITTTTPTLPTTARQTSSRLQRLSLIFLLLFNFLVFRYLETCFLCLYQFYILTLKRGDGNLAINHLVILFNLNPLNNYDQV